MMAAGALSTALLFAVSGTVVNQSTGQPQVGATVSLFKLGKDGPEAMTSLKSGAGGQFELPDTPEPGAPHMLQTAYQGVVYNKMLPPGRPTTGITVDVFNRSTKPEQTRVATHMVLLEPNGMNLLVNESIIWRNEGKNAFYDEKNGTMRFYLPPGAEGKVKVNCTAPQGAPIERPAVATGKPNIYTVDFPIKPGETRFDLMYQVPMTGPGSFDAKPLHGGAAMRLVAPQGVTLESGDKLQLLGQEPNSQASIYELKAPEARIAVTGIGSLGGDSGSGAEEAGEDGGEGLKQIRPRVYERFGALLGLLSLILVAALVLLYRKPEKSGA